MGIPERDFIVGLDIGGTKCTAVLVDGHGSTFSSRQLPSTIGGPRVIVDALLNSAMDLLSERGARSEQVSSVGIACGGPLDGPAGLILSPPNLPGWDEIPIISWVSARFPGIPVVLENDANASALAEWKFGAGRGCRNMVFLTFGTGLGAGLILDGRLYGGTNGLAGELGHWRMEAEGPVGYGKAGSLEGFCSGGGIARLAEAQVSASLARGEATALSSLPSVGRPTAKEVVDAARRGDAVALALVHKSARTLGRALALVIDLLNPERIVVGSIYARAEDLFRDAVAQEIEREALPLSSSVCTVVPAELGEKRPLYAPISVVF